MHDGQVFAQLRIAHFLAHAPPLTEGVKKIVAAAEAAGDVEVGLGEAAAAAAGEGSDETGASGAGGGGGGGEGGPKRPPAVFLCAAGPATHALEVKYTHNELHF